MKRYIFFFLAFKENVILVSAFGVFLNSSFTVVKSLYFSNIKNGNKRDAFQSLLTFIINNKKPSTESCGTPHFVLNIY